MALFSINDKVISITTQEKGIILEVIPGGRNRTLYRVKWSNRENDELEGDLLPDFEVSNPYERCKQHIFGSYSEYARKNTTFKILHSNNSTISSLKASKTLFRGYQFKPLLKFLNSPTRRLLIADEVGLGKTIEAGHILLELKARNELKNGLIVCSKSLQEKWKSELFDRFGLTFKVYDRGKEYIQDLIDNRGQVFGIVTYDTIRARKEKKEETEKEKQARKNNPRLVEYLDENPTRFSIIICDEAHQLRNANTLRYRGATEVLNRANAVLFLTATPVMLGTSDLYNQLHLLNSSQYYNEQVFTNMLSENAPFVRAISELNNNLPLPMIADHLSNAEVRTRYQRGDIYITETYSLVKDKFSEYPIYQRIMQSLNSKDDSNSLRAQIQMDLSSMSVMNNIFSRTRKREVTTDLSQAERKPHLYPIDLSNNEQFEFDSIIEEYTEEHSEENVWGEFELSKGATLGLIQKKRQISSSIYAYLNEESDLDRGIDRFENDKDSKFDELIKILKEVFSHGTEKIIVFAIFRKTIKYLDLRFKKLGYSCLLLTGETKDRASVIKEFKSNPKAHILLASEVGGEGLDMQFCNSLVNYDLPWNPMVLEQRIGRIDRFGQKSKVVNIYNMVVKGSIQEMIYERLLSRIGIFHNTVGDMEAILDAEVERTGGESITINDLYKKLEKELYKENLTKEEQQKKIDEVYRAIANVQESLKELETNMTNTLTNDAYFQNEINRILHNNAYVTESELEHYIEETIKLCMPSCSFTRIDNNTYKLKVPASRPRVLQNFLTQYKPNNSDCDKAFHDFKTKIQDKQELFFTFEQETAYNNPDLYYLNMYQPMVQAATSFYKEKNKDEDKLTTFSFALPASDSLKNGNKYFMAVYQFNAHQIIQGNKITSSRLVPILFDVNKNEICTDETTINHIFGLSQNEGKDKNLDYSLITDELIADLRFEFTQQIKKIKSSKENDLKIQASNARLRDVNQLKEWYKAESKSRQDLVREKTWELQLAEMTLDNDNIKKKRLSLNSAKGQLTRLENDFQERLSIIDVDGKPYIEDQQISLNYIVIE